MYSPMTVSGISAADVRLSGRSGCHQCERALLLGSIVFAFAQLDGKATTPSDVIATWPSKFPRMS
jgi:hypothetical protein